MIISRSGRSIRSFFSTRQVKMPGKSINLLRGWPSNDLLPAEALREASQTALSDPSIYHSGLLYGPDMGYEPLRDGLSEWLGNFYGPSVRAYKQGKKKMEMDENPQQSHDEDKEDPSRITITGGASQALACALQSFTDPSYTSAVWMVAPCYFLACNIFADSGLKMRAVPEDSEGIDLGYLSREIKALEEKEVQKSKPGYKDPFPLRKIYRHIIYCVPNYSNPSGRTMSLPRREGLVELARLHDALIITDDVYDMLQWHTTTTTTTSNNNNKNPEADKDDMSRALLPRLLDIDLSHGPSPHDPLVENLPPAMGSSSAPPPPPPSSSSSSSSSPSKVPSSQLQHFGHVLSNGSFSKLLGPGLRCGWTDSTPALARGMSQTGSTRSGGAAGHFASTLVAQLFLPPPPPPPSSSSPLGTGKRSKRRRIDTHISTTLLPAYARRHSLLRHAVVRYLVEPYGVVLAGGEGVGKKLLLEGGVAAATAKAAAAEEEGSSSSSKVAGGYFLWLHFPASSNLPPAKLIADRCRLDEDLLVGHGQLFEVHGDEASVPLDRDVRLCFAYEAEEDLVEGVERLGRVVGRMVEAGEAAGWGVGGGKGGVEADVDMMK